MSRTNTAASTSRFAPVCRQYGADGRWLASLALIALVIGTAAAGHADDPPVVDDSDAPTEQHPAELAWGMNFNVGLFGVPNAVPRAFLDLYQGHWSDGARTAWGGELFVRKDERHDFIFSVERQDYRTTDGLWLENGDPAGSASWITNTLRGTALVIEYNYQTPIANSKRDFLYAGLGGGIMVTDGELRTYELNTRCTDELEEFDVNGLAALERGEPCANNPQNDDLVLGRSEEDERTLSYLQDVPRVVPALRVTFGYRHIVADHFSLGLEAGIRSAAFYVGAEVGFVLPTRTPQVDD